MHRDGDDDGPLWLRAQPPTSPDRGAQSQHVGIRVLEAGLLLAGIGVAVWLLISLLGII